MTTPDFVQVPPDVPNGTKVDTTRLVVGANTVERQVIVLADPADPSGYVSVLASPPVGTEHGVAVRQVGSVTVTASAWPLPTGAATETTLALFEAQAHADAGVAHTDAGLSLASLGTDGATPPSIPGTGVRGWLRSIYDRLGGTLLVDGSAHTQPVSVASLPLPAGAATEATLGAFEAQAHADAGTIATDVVAVTTSLGTDGAAAPTIPGTGVRGWLRSIYDRLADGSQTTQILNIENDLFGTMIVGSLNNLIEVHYDDPAFATFLTITNTGAGAGPTQANGRVQWASGTTTSGTTVATTLDAAVYRPHFPTYAAFTAAFITPPTGATDLSILGLGDLTNGVFVGYQGTVFGILLRQGGVDTFVPQASWSEPAVTINKAVGNIFKVEVGLFGYAGYRVRWWNPTTRKWVVVHNYNPATADPLFTNFDLPMTLQIKKNASDATNVRINTACWGAGSSSLQTRMTDTITDRSLAATVRAVIVGKSTAGGTSYVPVKVNPAGNLAVANTSVGATGAAPPTDGTLIGGSDGTVLRAVKVAADGTVQVGFTRALVERMMAKAPQTGYTLWLDVVSSDATHIYIAEAPAGTASATAAFQGARVTLDASGNPLGAVATATAFAWDSRAAATWVT